MGPRLYSTHGLLGLCLCSTLDLLGHSMHPTQECAVAACLLSKGIALLVLNCSLHSSLCCTTPTSSASCLLACRPCVVLPTFNNAVPPSSWPLLSEPRSSTCDTPNQSPAPVCPPAQEAGTYFIYVINVLADNLRVTWALEGSDKPSRQPKVLTYISNSGCCLGTVCCWAFRNKTL